MKREMMLWGMLVLCVLCVGIVWNSHDSTRPGVVLTVVEQRVSVENEDLPTSPGAGPYPKAIYLSLGDQVRLVFDPIYEYSVDREGRPIRTRTPFRKVEIDILTGPHQGLSGFVPRNALSRREATSISQNEP